MTQRVASIMAEIGLDSNKFTTGVQGVLRGLNDIKSGMSGISAYAPIAGAAILAFGKYARDAVEDTVAYAKQVQDLSRLIGATPEDASRLIQVGDDVRISFETISTAMEAAIRKGYDPSIEGLEKITEKYQSIQNPIERSKYLMDTFGRSGADMAALLELPRDRLRELADDADRVGLTMSGANLQSAKEYAKSMDDLEDSLNGVKIQFGNHIIPSLNWLITNGSQVNKNIDEQGLSWTRYGGVLGGIVQGLLTIQQIYNSIAGTPKTPSYQSSMQSANANIGGFAYRPYATGGNFIVPPGFNNDSYPMRVQSGEHVSVTPAGQTSSDLAAIVRELRKLPTAIRDTMLLGAQ